MVAEINPYLDADRPSWEIRDEEPTLWFARFQEYLKLGPARSISDAALKTIKENPTAEWYKVARRFDWRERAADYDNEIAKTHRLIVEQAKIENQRNRIELLSKVYQKMLEAAEWLDPEMISWHSFAQAFKAWIDASRVEFEPQRLAIDLNDKSASLEQELENARVNLAERINKIVTAESTKQIDSGIAPQ